MAATNHTGAQETVTISQNDARVASKLDDVGQRNATMLCKMAQNFAASSSFELAGYQRSQVANGLRELAAELRGDDQMTAMRLGKKLNGPNDIKINVC